jgi:hypothetical protein
MGDVVAQALKPLGISRRAISTVTPGGGAQPDARAAGVFEVQGLPAAGFDAQNESAYTSQDN